MQNTSGGYEGIQMVGMLMMHILSIKLFFIFNTISCSFLHLFHQWNYWIDILLYQNQRIWINFRKDSRRYAFLN